jgi:hypothetical protein
VLHENLKFNSSAIPDVPARKRVQNRPILDEKKYAVLSRKSSKLAHPLSTPSSPPKTKASRPHSIPWGQPICLELSQLNQDEITVEYDASNPPLQSVQSGGTRKPLPRFESHSSMTNEPPGSFKAKSTLSRRESRTDLQSPSDHASKDAINAASLAQCAPIEISATAHVISSTYHPGWNGIKTFAHALLRGLGCARGAIQRLHPMFRATRVTPQHILIMAIYLVRYLHTLGADAQDETVGWTRAIQQQANYVQGALQSPEMMHDADDTSKSKTHLPPCTVRARAQSRLLTATLLLAFKFVSDHCFTARTIASISPAQCIHGTGDLVRLERELLVSLKFDLNVHRKQMFSLLSDLKTDLENRLQEVSKLKQFRASMEIPSVMSSMAPDAPHSMSIKFGSHPDPAGYTSNLTQALGVCDNLIDLFHRSEYVDVRYTRPPVFPARHPSAASGSPPPAVARSSPLLVPGCPRFLEKYHESQRSHATFSSSSASGKQGNSLDSSFYIPSHIPPADYSKYGHASVTDSSVDIKDSTSFADYSETRKLRTTPKRLPNLPQQGGKQGLLKLPSLATYGKPDSSLPRKPYTPLSSYKSSLGLNSGKLGSESAESCVSGVVALASLMKLEASENQFSDNLISKFSITPESLATSYLHSPTPVMGSGRLLYDQDLDREGTSRWTTPRALHTPSTLALAKLLEENPGPISRPFREGSQAGDPMPWQSSLTTSGYLSNQNSFVRGPITQAD